MYSPRPATGSAATGTSSQPAPARATGSPARWKGRHLKGRETYDEERAA
ncbi:hypothetical protein AB0C28_32645 [Nonomuraea sp. NPDC048892]